MKTLLILGAGVEQIPAIKMAKKMGLRVVVSDRNPNAPGFEYADEHFIASTMNAEESASAAVSFSKTHKIDGVIAIATDCPLTVAYIANRLNIPGISIKTAKLASNKLLMKNQFKKDAIPIPWFKEINLFADLKTAIKKRGFPLIIKPIDSRGARGVLLLKDGINLEWAYETSKNESPTKKVMIEEFLRGAQISTESIIIKGNAFTVGYSDRNYEFLETFSPYIIENGGQLPAILSEKQKIQINTLLAKASRSLGIKTGTIKGDIVMTKDGPKVIEIAARLSGGYFCSNIIPLSTGVDFLKYAIKLSLGEPVNTKELMPKYNKGVAQRFFFPKEGIVKSLSGADKVKRLHYIIMLGIYVKIGDRVQKITDHTKRAGFLIAVGKTREEAVRHVEEAVKTIKIETEK